LNQLNFPGKLKMTIQINGKSIPITASGFLENIEDWSEEVANHIAEQD